MMISVPQVQCDLGHTIGLSRKFMTSSFIFPILPLTPQLPALISPYGFIKIASFNQQCQPSKLFNLSAASLLEFTGLVVPLSHTSALYAGLNSLLSVTFPHFLL